MSQEAPNAQWHPKMHLRVQPSTPGSHLHDQTKDNNPVFDTEATRCTSCVNDQWGHNRSERNQDLSNNYRLRGPYLWLKRAIPYFPISQAMLTMFSWHRLNHKKLILQNHAEWEEHGPPATQGSGIIAFSYCKLLFLLAPITRLYCKHRLFLLLYSGWKLYSLSM